MNSSRGSCTAVFDSISYKLSEDFQGSLLYDVKKRLANAIWSKRQR